MSVATFGQWKQVTDLFHAAQVDGDSMQELLGNGGLLQDVFLSGQFLSEFHHGQLSKETESLREQLRKGFTDLIFRPYISDMQKHVSEMLLRGLGLPLQTCLPMPFTVKQLADFAAFSKRTRWIGRYLYWIPAGLTLAHIRKLCCITDERYPIRLDMQFNDKREAAVEKGIVDLERSKTESQWVLWIPKACEVLNDRNTSGSDTRPFDFESSKEMEETFAWFAEKYKCKVRLGSTVEQLFLLYLAFHEWDNDYRLKWYRYAHQLTYKEHITRYSDFDVKVDTSQRRHLGFLTTDEYPKEEGDKQCNCFRIVCEDMCQPEIRHWTPCRPAMPLFVAK